jgi:nitrite reductase/ring-hydroxylating ferredoxin subunit
VVPAAFPHGWFHLCESSQLCAGSIVPVRAFGTDLIAWRTQAGQIAVSEAFCPHLGANLAQGCVDGSRLTCAFHGWSFDERGAVCWVPNGHDPPRVRLRTLPAIEQYGHIWVWFAGEGDGPRWQIPPLDEYGSHEFGDYFRSVNVRIRTAWHELLENLVDIQHIQSLHRLPAVDDYEATFEDQVMSATFTQHVQHSESSDLTPIRIRAECHGPGISIIRFDAGMRLVSLSSVIPIEDGIVEARYFWLIAAPGRPALVRRIGNLFVDQQLRLFAQDVAIWESKRYVGRPPLLPSERLIREFRGWIAQFS